MLLVVVVLVVAAPVVRLLVAPMLVRVGMLSRHGALGHSDDVGLVDNLDISVGDDGTLLIRHGNDRGREGGGNDGRAHCELMYWMRVDEILVFFAGSQIL